MQSKRQLQVDSLSRNKIDTDTYILEPVKDFRIFDGFSCGDKDLDEFICQDACHYSQELLAITYALHLKKNGEISPPAVFASILNDAIRFTKGKKRKLFPFRKRIHDQYPAVKIGRFAVTQELKRKGIGTFFLSLLKSFFTTRNRTGCRFITVDAYPGAIGFYEKNDFEFLIPEKQYSEQCPVPMFFDLKRMLEK